MNDTPIKTGAAKAAPHITFFAEWEVSRLPEDLTEFHISCGVKTEDGEDEQDDLGYFFSDRDARLTIDKGERTWFVRLSAPTRGLEKEKGYWLSPNQVDGTDANEWGLQT